MDEQKIIYPSKWKALLIPFGVLSMIWYAWLFLGVFIIFMGINKVGVAGVIEAFQNVEDNGVLFYLLLYLAIIVFGILYRIIVILRCKIIIKEQEIIKQGIFFKKVFPKGNGLIKDVIVITELISLGKSIALKYEGKFLMRSISLSLYSDREIQIIVSSLYINR